jgi:hypothetical protein
VDAVRQDELRRAIADIAARAERTGRTLSIAEEADRLAERFPDISKRLICDMLIAAGLKQDLPLDMIDTDDSCRDSEAIAA